VKTLPNNAVAFGESARIRRHGALERPQRRIGANDEAVVQALPPVIESTALPAAAHN
jgi:hypothetical protein